MKTSRLLLLTFCIVGALNSARATTVIPPTFDELVGRAEMIFQSTVKGVKSQWTGEGAQRHIVTFVTLQVDDAIKGDAGPTYTLSLLGGTVDGLTMEVTDSPKFAVGDRDILFVEKNGTQFVPLVGIMYGRFRLQRDAQAGRDIVVGDQGEPVGDLARLGREDSKGTITSSADASQSVLVSTDFKAAIRAKLTTASK